MTQLYGDPLLRGEPLFNPHFVYNIVYQALKELKGQETFLLSEDVTDNLDLGNSLISSTTQNQVVTNLVAREGLLSFEVMTYGGFQSKRTFLSLSYVHTIKEVGSRKQWQKQQFLKTIRAGHWHGFKALLDDGIDLNQEDGIHPLNEAVRYNRLLMVEEMLKRGVDVNKSYDESEFMDSFVLPVVDDLTQLSKKFSKSSWA